MSETTLGITRIQYKVRAFAGAASDQLDEPTRPSHAGHRQRRGRQRRNPPSRGGRRRLAPRISLLIHLRHGLLVFRGCRRGDRGSLWSYHYGDALGVKIGAVPAIIPLPGL
jgi:hypothetical protein